MADLIDNCYIQIFKGGGASQSAGERLLFSFMPREGFRDEKSTNWTQIEVLGRSEPVRSWASSGVRTISFQLEFYAFDRIFEDVQQRVDWLRSLVYPDTEVFSDHSTSVSVAPPVVLLNVGSLYQNLRCVVKTVGVNWRAPWGSDAHHDPAPQVDDAFIQSYASAMKLATIEKSLDVRPMYAIVDLSMEEVDVGFKGNSSMRANPLRNPSIQAKRGLTPGPLSSGPFPISGLPSFIDVPPIVPGPNLFKFP